MFAQSFVAFREPRIFKIWTAKGVDFTHDSEFVIGYSLNLAARTWHRQGEEPFQPSKNVPGTHHGQSSSRHLESQAQPQLDLARQECRSKTQRLAWRERRASVHVERGITRGACACDRTWRSNAEKRVHLIVHTRKVCMVGDVEALRRKLQFCLLANLMLPAQAHVEIDVFRAKSGVTTGSDRTLIGGVIVAVDLATGQQVEWMATVVSKNRSQLKAGNERIFPRTFNYASHHDFVTLIEFRKSAVGAQVGRILRTIIAVKISTVSKPLLNV